MFLCPSPELNRRFVGVLGRAQRMYEMTVHAVKALSNHTHYLVTPSSGEQLSRFMHFVQTNLSKEIGDLVGWEGKLWSRRYQSIAVSDEDEAQIDRLRYLLANGVKEDLVARVRDWPGIGSARALLEDETLEGVWYDRTALSKRLRRGEKVSLEDVAESETLVLSPLPCWSDTPGDEVREKVSALVEAIDREAAERRRADGTGVLGPRKVCRRDPHSRPQSFEASPSPRFHAVTRQARRELQKAYNEFAARFREAAKLLEQGVRAPPFPPGSFPPGLPFVPHAAPG